MWNGEHAVPVETIGVALAVDSPTGLIAPVLRDPQAGRLDELVADIRDAVAATRAGSVGLDRLSGGTTVFSIVFLARGKFETSDRRSEDN